MTVLGEPPERGRPGRAEGRRQLPLKKLPQLIRHQTFHKGHHGNQPSDQAS
jgi:hypothetical protein